MAYSTINKSTSYFNTVSYSGTGSAQSITGVGFRPDWLWIKHREDVSNHKLQDVIRGSTKVIGSNETSAEATVAQGVTSFDSDGFSLGTDASVNGTGSAGIVAWNWLAGGSQGSSNTDGSLNTTYTSVNTTAGFSISKYTGTGSSTNYGHGLGAVPKMIFTKNLTSGTAAWRVSTTIIDGTYDFLHLNTNGTKSDDSVTAPTSSLIYLDNSTQTNTSSQDYISYAFAEKVGYSKFGSYTGNGNADGTFIYTGFKPAFIIVKRTDSANNWTMYDNKRNNSFNEITHTLIANGSDAESTSTSDDDCDFLSNGVKMRCSNNGSNGSSASYIYMAFGQSLVGSNNVPCTAR